MAKNRISVRFFFFYIYMQRNTLVGFDIIFVIELKEANLSDITPIMPRQSGGKTKSTKRKGIKEKKQKKIIKEKVRPV